MNWLDASPFWLRLLFGIAGSALTWWSAIDLGRYAFAALRISRAVSPAAGAALGYALLGTIVALFGFAHLITLWTFLTLFAVQAALRLAFDRRFALPPSPAAYRAYFVCMPGGDKLAVIVTAFAWLTGVIAAALPATWWDPIAYHLPIAGFALANHALGADAMVQSVFPLLGEAAALPAYAIGGSAGAALTTLGAGIALALVCSGWAERIAAGSGRLAGAMVSCSALWIWLAPSFYVDVPFAMFAVTALALAANGRAEGEEGGAWSVAAGLLAGAAAATKYPGIIVVLACVGVAIAAAPRGNRLRSAADVAAAALLVAAGWYMRTAALTGDPLFPFLSTTASGEVGGFAQRYVTMTRQWCGGSSTLADAVALPIRLMTEPRTFCGDPGYALDLGAVFVLASLFIARRTAVVLAACAALTAFWFFSSQQLRFLVPAVCLFAIAAAAGTTVVPERSRPIVRALLVVLCTVGVLVNWLPGPARDASNSIAPGFAYVAGAQSGDDYLSQRLEFYDAVLWVRAHPRLDARGSTLRPAALDDVRDYYFGPDVRWLNPYYQAYALDWHSPDRYRRLRRAGFIYLIVNANDAYVHRTPTGIDWTVLREDAADGTLRARFEKNGVTVYELPPVAGAKQ